MKQYLEDFKNNDIENIKLNIETDPHSVALRDEYGNSLLHYAILWS